MAHLYPLFNTRIQTGGFKEEEARVASTFETASASNTLEDRNALKLLSCKATVV